MPPLPPFALPESARRHTRVSAGLFVGVREFEDPELSPVRFAVDDAVDLAHLFALELGLIDPGKTVVLLAGEPQKPESRQRLATLLAIGVTRGFPSAHWIFDHLYRLGQQTSAEGLLVASIATHGLTDQGKAILAVSGTSRRRPVTTGLPFELMLEDLRQSRAERRLLLVDACRERFGGATRALGDPPEPFSDAFVAAMRAARGCASLAGASAGGYAYDDIHRGNGVFTAALIDGLRGGVDGNDEALITLERVANFADEQVRDWVRAHRPQHVKISLGISASYDPPGLMASMPLAVDDKRDLRDENRKAQPPTPQQPINPSPQTPALQQSRLPSSFDRPGLLRRLQYWMWSLPSILTKPEWATAAGIDSFGDWVELKVDGAVQRFRWIAPGGFLMGSPTDEVGGQSLERPRHLVTLSRGFWLGDTPCTQAFFETVTKKNPSQFNSRSRPVENLTRRDIPDFFFELERRCPGIKAMLPTEAQWEFACRAGSDTSTYAGDLTILGERNSPTLDAIAWYAGNCGKDFDLPAGIDSSGWEQKQYSHQRAGTREVAQKAPNARGLYDMLGNVWEWCEDVMNFNEPYDGKPRVDPMLQPRRGGNTHPSASFSICRGGSWLSEAGQVRAASRRVLYEYHRSFDLGFRFAIIDHNSWRSR